MNYVLPDYHNCGLNVASAVLRHFGAECHHAAHPLVQALLQEKKYKNIVMMLFDGLAMAALAEHLPEDSFLRAHVAQRMTAVFPSTTVAATTSIESGEAPCEHGWLGWSMYFEQIDRMVDVFIDRDSFTGEPMGGETRVIEQYMPYCDICQKLNATGNVHAQIVSPFGDTRVDTLDALFDTAAALCRAPGRQYIYTYWGEPDHTMHSDGVMSVGALVRDIDARVQRFCQGCGEDTLVLVTADHGLLDVEPVFLSDYPHLEEMCVRPFHIEARAAAFFIKPEYREAFPAAFADCVGGDDFLVLQSDEAVRMGLFGDGEPHPCFRTFLGDYLVIATGRRSLILSRDAHLLTAMHAGLTEREMYVPLIVGKK